jgi:hypothetical protein
VVGCLQVYPLILLGQQGLGEEEWVLVVLHHLGILLVVLPKAVIPIRTGFLVVHSFPAYLEGLLDLVRLPGIGLRRPH